MKLFYCARCGSTNHAEFDCSKPAGTVFVPSPELQREIDRRAQLEQQAAPVEKAEKTAVKEEPMFDPPRFKGCPQICNATNLPAHESEADMYAFLKRYGPSCKVIKVGQCKVCSKWHMKTDAPAPAGGSSGTTRENTPLPKVLFRRKLRESSFAHDLPSQFPREIEPAAEQPKESTAPVKKTVVGSKKKALKSKPGSELL